MGMILGFLATGFNGLIVLAITACLSLLGGSYLGYTYQKNHYEAKINAEKVATYKALQQTESRNATIVGQYINKIRIEQDKSANYQNQIRHVFSGVNTQSGAAACRVPFGFIRLHNAAASGQTSEPTGTDAIASDVDLATVLSAITQNYGKYRQAAEQVEAAQAAAQ